MLTAAVFDRKIQRVVPASSLARLSRVEIFESFAQIEHLWRRLECADIINTPFQSYDFVTAWQRNVGDRLGVTPFAIVAYDQDDHVVALLPLVLQRAFGMSIACFPGGKYASFNMPLWRRDFACHATSATMQQFIRLIADAHPAIDAFALMRQPEAWNGAPNPMLLLPRQRAVNECPLLRMELNAPPSKRISNSFRKRLKQKERKLAANPGFRYTIATSSADAKRLLDAFFATKPRRLAAQGLPNVFAEPGNEQFFRELAEEGLTDRDPILEVHALECDDEVISVFAGITDHGRFSTIFNTYTMSANAKYSPGLILVRNIIDHYAAAGYTSLDLGTGADDYKLLFCKQREALFDSFLPTTMRGRMITPWFSMEAHVKRFIKRSTLIMRTINRLRAGWLNSRIDESPG